jgi:hypothetical protein
LEDGAVLNAVSNQQNNSPTVFMGQPPMTGQSQPFQTTPQQNWGTSSISPPPPSKKSKAWMWGIGIVGVLLLLFVVGIVGIIAFIASLDDKPSPPPPSTPNKTTVLKDDFSKTNWYKAKNNNGNSEYRNGEFVISSNQIGYLYVLVTGDKTFKTWNANTSVTVRNVNGTPTNLGYGLAIHNNPFLALDKDYAFLIDSTKQSYRIVQHQNKTEKILVNWTKFSDIRSGTQSNEIEVRDENGRMAMYINGKYATSVTDSVNFKDGVAGVYAGDAIPIAFSNLQLSK